jgi:uncharacterized protein YjbJ (UPF0337 family)
MSTKSKLDEAKGRAKEAAGALIDDDKLRREGKRDQAAGKVEDVVDKVVEKAKHAADTVQKKAEEVVDRARDALRRPKA